MNYHDIPDFDDWTAWQTANGSWEVRLKSVRGNTVLHLSEDKDAASDQIEDGKFYLTVEHGATGLKWVRERKGIEMDYDIGSTVDADYVEFHDDGTWHETQHNHVHLDHDVENEKIVALTPV